MTEMKDVNQSMLDANPPEADPIACILHNETDERELLMALIHVYNSLSPAANGQLSQDQHNTINKIWSQHFNDGSLASGLPSHQIAALKAIAFLMDRLLLSPLVRSDMQQGKEFHQVLQQSFLISETKMHQQFAVHILRRLFDGSGVGVESKAIAAPASSWQAFFVINDTINDKQIHLILPALDLLHRISGLPFGWRWVLITKALQTSSKSIHLKLIRFIVAMPDISDLSECSTHSEDLFRNVFMNVLNSTSMFGCDDRVAGGDGLRAEELRSFLWSSSANGTNIVQYLRPMCTINWLIVPLFHISRVLGDDLVRSDHRHLLWAFVARVSAQPNVHLRNRILSEMRNRFVAVDTKADDEAAPDQKIRTMFFGRLADDSYDCEFGSQLQLCDITTSILVFDKQYKRKSVDTDVPLTILEANEHLNGIHIDICNIVQQYCGAAKLANDWQRKLRDALNHDARLSGFAELLVLNEREFLVGSPLYVNLRQCMLTNAFVRLLSNHAQHSQSFVLELCEDYTVLAISIVLVWVKSGAIEMLLNVEELLDGIWLAMEQDLTSAHCLAGFMTLLDELSRLQSLSNVVKLSFFRRIAGRLPDRPRWHNTVASYMTRSKAFARFMVQKELLLFEQLRYGCKMIGDQIAEFNLLKAVYGTSLPSDCNAAATIRASAINCLLDVNRTPGQLARYQRLRTRCLNEITNIYRTKPRHFANSMSHRHIFRLLQVCAVLTHIDGRPTSGLEELLYDHNHQPGVAHLLELLVAAQATPDGSAILAALHRATGPNARRSAIVCLHHVHQRYRTDATVARQLLDALLPWTMGKDFGIRVLAQFVCQRILAGVQPPETDNNSGEFGLVAAMLAKSLASADQRVEYDRLCRDYRFGIGAGGVMPDDSSGRHLVAPVLVLHDVPLLSGICPTEVIPLQLIGGAQASSLAGAYAAVSTDRCADSRRPTIHTTPVALNVDNVQRKIVPLRQMFPEWTDLRSGDGVGDSSMLGATVRRGALVVVASLLTKEANVGGLARTCEIFGAKELVLANLKMTESREFQALSMTAEKWLVTTEVKPFHLIPYLLIMRQEGYTIIGAEQTANGISIDQVQFPVKTLLLLGNEQQGIPADLLSLLDKAVEVPQVGIVRSLNVHVTGALFVWEYAKQHSFYAKHE